MYNPQEIARTLRTLDGQNSELREKISQMLNGMSVGELMDFSWPFWIPFLSEEISFLNKQNLAFATVSADAAFIVTQIVATTFSKINEDSTLDYLNVDSNPQGMQNTRDVTWTLRDSSSTRVFNGTPMPMEAIGTPKFPTILSQPLLVVPNAKLQMNFAYGGEDEEIVYDPKVTLLGFRLRLPRVTG